MNADEIRARICAELGEEREDWLERALKLVRIGRLSMDRQKQFDLSTVGTRIRTARQLKGLTVRQLGLRWGVAPSTVARIERGALDLQVSRLPALSLILETTQEWIAMLSDEGGPRVAARPKRGKRRQCNSEQRRQARIRERLAEVKAKERARIRAEMEAKEQAKAERAAEEARDREFLARHGLPVDD